MTEAQTYRCGSFFDGENLHKNAVLQFGSNGLEKITSDASEQNGNSVIDLGNDIVSPGYVDLQVNGGGGVLLNDEQSRESVAKIAEAHWTLGVRKILPTLITDTREKSQAAINATIGAISDGARGVAGLHLEGPHLSVARKGAHVPALIRPMEKEDLEMLVNAAQSLPALMVTIAPENTTADQVRVLSQAGAIISLGHTDTDYDTCMAYAEAGASCVTHLFNAMSQMGNREPGVVGAALASGKLSSGLIADGIHVHPEMIRIAWTAKAEPGEIFLVSDAMSVAGTRMDAFDLCGRHILRASGKLTLEDGTLAGADLDLTTAVRVLVEEVGIPLKAALRAATKVPMELISSEPFNVIGMPATDFIRITPDLKRVGPVA